MNKFGLILRGMGMGIAEVIPGVSGGTIAFITGIYKRLIDSIKAINLELIKALFSFQFKKVWDQIDGPFLVSVFTGMLGGVLIGIFAVSHMLEQYPEVLWALFFGLILASIPMMLAEVKLRNRSLFIPFILGAVIAFGITSLSPSEGSTAYWYIFLAGTIAITALILPGISGSFMLLLLGLYTFIIPTIKTFLGSPSLDSFLILAVFGLGCLTGLAVFSRIVSQAFEKHHDITIVLMSGFLLGSLNKIWPWRNPLKVLDKETGETTSFEELSAMQNFSFTDDIKILQEQNVMPSGYFHDPMTILVLVAFVIGVGLIFSISYFNRQPSEA